MSGERPIPRTAAEWIARLNADGRTADDEQAFRAWLAADTAHAADFERVTDIWALVPGTDAAVRLAPARSLSRRRMLAACTGTLVVGGGGMAIMQTAYAGTRYQTGIGEQRQLTLAEGSSLFLDADTDVRVLASASRRRLWLERGRVALTVKPATAPFAIDAGRGSFVAGSGRFDVRRDTDDKLAMTALVGQAEVAIGGGQRSLSAGQRIRTDAADVVQVDRPDVETTQAWLSGRAAFHDDRLDTVAAEANRYSLTRLVIADPDTAALRVSGMYRVGDNVALGQALSQLLSVPVRQVGDRVLLGG
ncbi:iron dicitrate transport regulator FecR [Sphingobium lactosutens]|uniref:FecR family protein n=1 Tax=Sphingobium lactosutens TaxID=522773 RepID=UPI0015BF12D9|nr:FecR domain-containing protein [Sphingobium lactosutens]NWK94353.1 iron dicitrate transport regulator FecR [Sphingobium lactosutens]